MPSSTPDSDLSAILRRANEAQAGPVPEAKERPAGKTSRAASAAPAARAARSKPERKPRKRRAKTPAPARGRVGRPATGKRSDPDFAQATVWLNKTTLAEVDIALRRARLADENLGDRSDLIERLLTRWLKRKL